MADARLQDDEDVEGGVSTDEEFVTSVYMLEGKYFSISKESQETIQMLSDQLREALPDTGQRTTDMEKIIDRVQALMATNFKDIKAAKRLKDKVRSLRTTLRKRITEMNKRILPMIEIRDPTGEGVDDMISALNEAVVELQRLLIDEAATTLILRRDMTQEETIGDVLKRKDRIDVANELIQQAREWVSKFGPGEGNPRGTLQVLGSAGVPEDDADYDTSVARHSEDDDQRERTAELQEDVQPVSGSISPEPSKRPVTTSTPHDPNAPLPSPQTIPRIGRAVSFAGVTDENALRTGETVPILRRRDPAGPKPTLRAHEEQYFRLQNQSQTELPLVPDDLTGAESTEYYTANDQTLKSTVHEDGDNAFTQAIKNLSNNLVIQYNQPSANEKVPKFDGDYTKWNAFWQAFTVLVDKNPKVPVISKLNKLNQAVEGEAAMVISMFEFDEESYELAKMALINEYGDPALCANKMLRDLQNLDRVKANDIEGLRNLHVRSKQLVLRLQRLYPTILDQPILVSSTIENKMSPECLYEWEKENTKRKRESSLPPPHKHIQWILNWLGDYIQTNKRSTIKMHMGDEKKRGSTGGRNNGNGGAIPKSLNNFYLMAEQRIPSDQPERCIFCEGNHFAGKCRKTISATVAIDKARKAKVCLNCLKTGHFAKECQFSGCKEVGCNGKHHSKLHGGNFRSK